MPTVNIKVADPSDATIIIQLLKQLAHESDTVVIDPHLPKLTARRESRQISLIDQTRSNVIMIARLKDRAIGIVTVQRSSLTAGEVGIAVEKRFWHRGLGTVLLREAVRWFKSFSSLKCLWLDVEAKNRIAIHLYLKQGFKMMKKNRVRDANGRLVHSIRMIMS